MTLRPNVIVYRLILSFESQRSGHLNITNWQVPDGAMLFIINDNTSYTGPYMNRHGDKFISGRFMNPQQL